MQRAACVDHERGIYYAAQTLSSCIVEIFGDTRVIEFGDWHVAAPRVSRALHLLDLTGPGAMRAGSVAALAKIPERPQTQEWSRFFYDTDRIYPDIDGLVFLNAHNDEEALALYERASRKLDCPQRRIIRFDDDALRAHILMIAEQNDLILENI